ncbi:MAG: DUF547 domain-containing protein [Deltaproteobacteria bacterium]|nr:MAG: DUF547 domain-containing protein [Deltaproteobacteria bacterium]
MRWLPLLLLAACGPLDANPVVVRIFGPPVTEMHEAYAADVGTASFSHAAFDQVLAAHVRDGRVDYPALASDRGSLDAYLAQLAEAPFDALDRDAKLALLLNAYNAFTLALILDHWPVDSILDIPTGQRWNAERWQLGGRTLSLSQLEHELLRTHFVEPRLHFAINCASLGCPPLRDEAFAPERLEAQLEAAAHAMHHDPRWLHLDPATREVRLTKLYAWYASDFDADGAPLPFAARYRPELADGGWRVGWLDYDWSLNRQ